MEICSNAAVVPAFSASSSFWFSLATTLPPLCCGILEEEPHLPGRVTSSVLVGWLGRGMAR